MRRKTGYPAHPIKHLLFGFWFFDGDARQWSQELPDDVPVVQVLTDNQPSVNLTILAMLRAGGSMESVSRITGKSRCYIRRIAECNCIQHVTNSQVFSYRIRYQVTLLALLGRHRQSIASWLNVGTGYVEQVISNTPGLTLWRKQLKEYCGIHQAAKQLCDARELHPNWRRMEFKANYSK